MEMKKMVMVLACVMLLSAFAIGGEALAAPPAFADWYNCTVLSVGSFSSNAYFIFVTNNDAVWAGPRVFLMDGAQPGTKSMLATALTGYAGTGQVSLYMPPPAGVAPNTFVSAVLAGSL
jgi:hypothetical protein